MAGHFPMIAVGIRMLLPCLITGAFAFTTTSPGEFTAALRRMHVPEAVIIPCIVVIRFFPTLREDYRHIRNAMGAARHTLRRRFARCGTRRSHWSTSSCRC